MVQDLNYITYEMIYEMFCIQNKTYTEISEILKVSKYNLVKHIGNLGINKHTYQDELYNKGLWKCNKCKTIKNLQEFRIKLNKQLYKDISNTCKTCDSNVGKDWYNKNTQLTKDRAKKHREENPERHKELARIKAVKSRKEKPHIHRLKSLLSRFIKATNQNKDMKTTVMVGYSYNDFKNFIDSSELPLKGNHVDHKCPISWMYDNVPAHIANSLDNLQIITENENETKSQWWSHPLTIEYYDLLKQWIKDKYKNRFTLQGNFYVDTQSKYYIQGR
jgi:hypothetical protein